MTRFNPFMTEAEIIQWTFLYDISLRHERVNISVAAKRRKDNNCLKRCYLHCMKSVRIRSFSGPYFSAFELNPEIYGVSLRI